MPRPTKPASRPTHHTLFEPVEARQLMASIAWDGGGDGTTLTQAANWAGDVLPGTADDAVMNVAGNPSLVITGGAFSVHSLTCAESLTIGGGTVTIGAPSAVTGPLSMSAGVLTGDGNLSIGSTFNWTGGSMAGNGATTLSASTVATLAGYTKGCNRNFVNNGTVNLADGNLGGFSGPGVSFTNNGAFNAGPSSNCSLAANNAPNTFINNGTFTKTGSTTLAIDGFVFNGSGAVTVSGGTLTFAAGGTMTGPVTVAAGATMNHGTGSFTYASGATFAGTGAWNFANGTTTFDVTFAPAGLVTIPYGTLTLNAPSQSIANLNESGGAIAGTGDLTITAGLNWTGGRIGGTGLLTIGPSATATLASGSLGVNRDMTNEGTINWIHSSLGGYPGPGVTFTNNGTLNINLDLDDYFYGNTTSSTLVNNGTINKNTAYTAIFSNCALVNVGSLNINGGDLQLMSGGSLGGTITLASGSFLDTSGGTFDDTTGTISGAGTARFLGGVHNLGGNLTDGVITSIDNTTFSGAGDIAFNALTDWNSGSLNGSGTATIGPGVILTMATYATKNLGRTLVNNGRIEHSLGYLQFTGGAILNNSPGKTYNLTDSAHLYAIGTGNVFNNAGTLNIHSTDTVEIAPLFNNSGNLNVFTGTLFIDGGGTNTGHRNIAAGATLTYRAGYSHGAGSTTAGSGILNFNGGTQTISGDWTSGVRLQLLQGTLTGPGNLTNNGPFSWGAGTMTGPGAITIGTPGKLALTTGANHILGRNIINNGQFHFLNGALHLSGTTIANHASGTLVILPDSTISVLGSANSIINAGHLKKMGATTATLDSAFGGVTLSNTGLVDVRNGTLNFNGTVNQVDGTTLSGGSWQVLPAGTLGLGTASIRTIAPGTTVSLWGANSAFAALANLTTNNGTLDLRLGGVEQFTPVGGTFTNNGLIHIGEDRALQISGNLVQGSTGSITLDARAASRYGRVLVSGTNTLGGSLTFNFTHSYVPATGMLFNFLQGAARTGTFDTVSIAAIPGHTSHIAYLPTGAKLVIS